MEQHPNEDCEVFYSQYESKYNNSLIEAIVELPNEVLVQEYLMWQENHPTEKVLTWCQQYVA
jgi:hypothetical protein